MIHPSIKIVENSVTPGQGRYLLTLRNTKVRDVVISAKAALNPDFIKRQKDWDYNDGFYRIWREGKLVHMSTPLIEDAVSSYIFEDFMLLFGSVEVRLIEYHRNMPKESQ